MCDTNTYKHVSPCTVLCACTLKNRCYSFIFKSYNSICLHIINPRCLANHFALVKQVWEREVALPMAIFNQFVEQYRWLKTRECLFCHATVSYDVPRSTISDKILKKFLWINVHGPEYCDSDNTVCSVRNFAHCPIITFCIKICLECNYLVALFIK